MAAEVPSDADIIARRAADARRSADELRAAEDRRVQQEATDVAHRRSAETAAALQARADAAAAAAAERRRLADDVTRHEQALAAARQRLQVAYAAVDGEIENDDVPAADAQGRNARRDGSDPDPVAALHAQALGILNIRGLVPVVLDLATPSFSKWRRLFLLVLGKYALADHVLCDASFPDVAPWLRMDLHVLSWLYGSISPELYEIVTTAAPTARTTWLALEEQFVGNRETRIVLVDTEFRTLCQGALSISDYCRRMKTLADSLVELGEPISDRLLTINLLRGLNDRFAHLRSYLKRQRPFPSFVEVRSELLLEELSMGPVATSAAPSVLVASTPTSAPGTATALASGPPPPQASGGYGRRRRKGKASGGSNPSGARGTPGGARGQATFPQGSWPNVYNPWTGSIHMWPGPVQGHRPAGSTSHQAFVGGPPPPAASWAPTAWPTTNAPSWSSSAPVSSWAVQPPTPAQPQVAPGPFGPWDQPTLAAAFNTMTLTPPQGEWYMDSGATAHMASTSGPQHTERDRQVQ
eukprot:XP_008664224.1 uncharacterized protein LOC103642825 [Zea mays]